MNIWKNRMKGTGKKGTHKLEAGAQQKQEIWWRLLQPEQVGRGEVKYNQGILKPISRTFTLTLNDMGQF